MPDHEMNEIISYTDETDKWHNPYDQELREQDSIKRGDTEALQKSWEESYSGEIGKLSHDPLRNIKNLAIGVITLSSRSAISGGLNPETVFTIVDTTILHIERMTVPEEIRQTIHKTQLQFAQMVHDSNSNGVYNPIINKAKDYIFRNIHEKITVSEIAAWLGINADYLSSLFHRSESKTLGRYIMEEKIKLCCNMLKFSDYSIQRIAVYFGFCSQSHFTKQFKSCMNMTPGEYRKKYKVSWKL